MTSAQQEFHQAEFEQLHKEIDDSLQASRDLLRWIIVGSAAYFAWLATHPPKGKPLTSFAGYVPCCLAVLGLLYTAISLHRIRAMGRYLKKLESFFGDPALGWEHFLADEPTTLTWVGLVLWGLLIAFDAIAPSLLVPMACVS